MQYDKFLIFRGSEKMPLVEQHLGRTQKYLKMIRDMLDANDVEFLLTVHPYGIHVGKDQWNEGRVFWGFEKNTLYDDYSPYERMREFSERNGIAFFNSLPAFLKDSKEKLFFDLDGHLTFEGNKTFTKALCSDSTFLDLLNTIGSN
jgi:hypothetical protein